MKKWIKDLIVGDRFDYLKIDIDNLDHEVRQLRKEIANLRSVILYELIANKFLLKQILEQRKKIQQKKFKKFLKK